MNSDVVLNKVETIRRCIRRIEEVYQKDPENLKDYTKQDSIILNIQRACEAAIDLAMHLIAEAGLGLPQSSREAFDILEKNDIIASPLTERLKAMVGFRNIAVHDYQAIKIEIVRKIVEKHLSDFTDLIERVIQNNLTV